MLRKSLSMSKRYSVGQFENLYLKEDACMQRVNIKCCHCGDYTPFITDENIEVIPKVNLTSTDMDCLGDIAEALRECGCLGTCDFLRRVQSEVTKIVEYQEER